MKESLPNPANDVWVFQWDDAMSAARDYRGGGLSDWRVPTKEESFRMHQARSLWLDYGRYFWSSTPWQDYQNVFYCTEMVMGWQQPCGRSDYNRVRLVRNF